MKCWRCVSLGCNLNVEMDVLYVFGVCRIARDFAKVVDQVRFLTKTLLLKPVARNELDNRKVYAVVEPESPVSAGSPLDLNVN